MSKITPEVLISEKLSSAIAIVSVAFGAHLVAVVRPAFALDLDGDPLLRGNAETPQLTIDSTAEKSKNVTVKPGKLKVLRPANGTQSPSIEKPKNSEDTLLGTVPAEKETEIEATNANSWEAEFHEDDEILLDYNIRLNPVGLLARAASMVSLGQRIGLLHVALDFNVVDSLTIGPLFSAAVLGNGTETTNSINVGVRLNYYFTGKSLTSGWVVGPQIEYTFGRSTEASIQQSVESLSFAAMGGYHWVFPSGFNVLATLGISASREGLSIYPEVCFGYAF